MKKVSEAGKLSMVEKSQYMCSIEKFNPTTDLEDGSTLMVVDTAQGAVVGYFIAFDGIWNAL